MVDTGFYIWDVPHLDDVFYDCLIKITTNSDKATQISKRFTIINQTNKIRIKYPNGGELIESGSRFKIQWKSNSLKAELFKIFFSDNGGRTWDRLESRVLTNEYLWKVPNIESENCKIKIVAVENKNIYDISEQSFTISKTSKLKISNPTNNQKYYLGDLMKIDWNVINVRGKKVNIYYSQNKGLDWIVISRGVPNKGKFNWEIPSLDTTSKFSKIKVELSNNSRIYDINNGHFILYGEPEISIKTPIEKDLVIEDKSNYKIMWDSKNIRENRINLYYSDNQAVSWKVIALDIPNKGYYNWLIPSLNTVDCLFKVESSVQPEVYSVSDYSLKITEKPLIMIENNLNNNIFNVFDSLALNWKSYNLSDKYLDVLLSEDNGQTWKTIYENIIDSGNKIIKIPFVSKTSSSCQLKIIDRYNKDNFSITDNFKIKRPRGLLRLLSNNDKEYNYNDVKRISWESTYLDDQIGKIYFSLNSGQDWEMVDEVSISGTYYDWEIPNLENPHQDCLLKISISNIEYDFIDDLSFYKINAAPIVKVENNIQDTIKTNMPFYINVDIKNSDNRLYNLYYSLTRGLSWNKIANKIDAEQYLWNVPSIKGFDKMIIKAELDSDNSIVNLKTFEVLEQSINLTLLSPNGDESYKIGDVVNIVWSIKKIYDKNIDLFYSLDAGENWIPISLKAPNFGTFDWILDDRIESSNFYKVKVQSINNKEIFDVSDGLFKIKGSTKAFNIITPNGGDLIYRGTSTFVYWEDLMNDIQKVDIFYSTDNGKSWELISENIDNGGVYNWVISDDIKFSNKCLVKIVSSSNNGHVGFSDNVFTIK